MSDSAIKSTLQGFIQQGEGILRSMEQARKPRQENALAYIARETLKDLRQDALGEIAHEAARYIGLPRDGPKRAVKRYLRLQEKQALQAQKDSLEAQFEAAYQSWASGIGRFLSTVSVAKPNLKKEGNSYDLLGRLARNEEFSKVETKVRRMVGFLKSLASQKLVYNTEVASILQERAEAKNKDAYKILEDLEISTRKFIERELSRLTPNWWKERVPEDVRKNAEDRKQKDEAKTGADLHPINYVDFADYIKIILRRDNWEQTFTGFFKDRDIISAKFREREPIRNAVMHPRPLSAQQIAKLRLYAREIREWMKRVRG